MTPLRGVRVLEVGDRIGVGLTGALLALLGADVAVAVPRPLPGARKWRNPAAALHRKRAIDATALPAALAEADVVVAATDVAPLPSWPRGTGQIICDITAHAAGSPRAAMADSDAMVAALAGLVDITGPADGAPVLPRFPMLEGLAALHAAAAILAALLARRGGGLGQDVAVTLHDRAIACLSAFRAPRAAARPASRSGNRHPVTVPSNLYPARDGDVAICAATDDQFRRLAAAIHAPRLTTDARYATAEARLTNQYGLDAAVAAWTSSRPVAEAVAAMDRVGLPAAPVLARADLLADPNLAVRGSLEIAPDPVTALSVPVLARPIHLHANAPRPNVSRPNAPCEAPRIPWVPPAGPGAAPLAGLAVVELGGSAAAPPAGNHLAALGAQVIKLEPPRGDPARAAEPAGPDLCFARHKAGRETRRLDIRRPDGMQVLRRLLAEADVLLESLRPGTLAALGLDTNALGRINPRLTHCTITGFGALAAYPRRPAFDLVAQAMSGIMDRTRAEDGTPFRAGVPVCAIAAGLAGLVAVLAGLLLPAGGEADISMQDVGAWLTHWDWNDAPAPRPRVVPCADGYAVVEDAPDDLPAGLARAALVAHVIAAGGHAAPVRTVAEVLAPDDASFPLV